VSKRSASPGLGSLRAGGVTALSLAIVTAVSAIIGVVIAREFGRSAETDGLLSAYGVFLVIVIAAQSIRVAVLPQLAAAEGDGRLAGEVAGATVALLVVATPLVLVAELAAGPLAGVLTGADAGLARETAEHALRWMVPAACAYLFAALAASALAALDDYGTAALGFAAGSISGLTVILLRAEQDGILAVAWGIALNGTIALAVPTVALAVKAALARMPVRAVRPTGPPLTARLGAFAVAASLPLALQLLYVVCLPFAGRLGEGAATSFVYAYLAAASLVAVAASSLGLVTSVPLARIGLDAAGVARHVLASSWLALAFIGGACGVVAVAGAEIVEGVLGAAYGEDVGFELGRVIVLLAPWMAVSVGVTVAFPLAFVVGRTRQLPLIAITALAVQVPLAWAGSEALGLDGLALALGVSTGAVLATLLVSLDALGAVARDLVVASFVVVALVVGSYVVPSLVLGPWLAAIVGLIVYAGAFFVLRPEGLRRSWAYLRALA
jgi:hypothetical protein